MRNYLTIDVEDYFQVAAFESVVNPARWDGFESRVEKNTTAILKLLAEYETRATFFVVGWIAERYPNLVKTIAAHNHEIGCHSYRHRKIYDMTPEKFLEDTSKAKDILEQLTGQPVLGYRAPSYSITPKSLWALRILAELGFQYDSSIFPIHHDIYGIPNAPRFTFYWDLTGESPTPALQPGAGSQTLLEYPLSTAQILGQNIPIAGGGYFRLFPYWLTKTALKRINTIDKKAFIFYLHPWEIDPGQPRFNDAPLLSRFRHYNNLQKTAYRFTRLLKEFNFGPLATMEKLKNHEANQKQIN